MNQKYRNQCAPIEERVEDLLLRMTLKEKVGQLNQRMYGWKAYRKTANGYEVTEAFKEEIAFGDGVGALYGLFRADPWSAVTFENGIPVGDSAKVANMLQRYVMENTRLGIPMLISEECPHGHQALDGTMFPVNIGVGSTWNPGLYQEAFSHVASEIRSRGANLGLVSTLDILTDPRWGRSEECYGEDPYLAARLTEAVVKGLQGECPEDLKGSGKVAAVVKHFCAQGAAVGGHNGKSAVIGERELREIHLPGMKAGVEAGAMVCMAAYNEIDGIPCHANSKLLTEILRTEWGYKGVVMSDGCAVDMLKGIAGDEESAGVMALKAGVDLNLWSEGFLQLEKAVRRGKVSEGLVDRAVRRILRLKFLLGLFDRPLTDEEKATELVGNEKSQAINLSVARESIVLLRNEHNTLPISRNIGSVAVIGPNADNIYNQLGDYTPPQRTETGVTVLQGIQAMVSAKTRVTYAKGCGIRDISKEGFEEAVRLVENSDIAILVLGGSSTRDFNIQFDINGAAILNGNPTEMDCGEGVDVAELELGGVQLELVQQIVATGTPVVVVLIQGRPHAIPWIADNCDGILCAWYPGKEGGQAVAEVLFGEVAPSGKLSVSIPRSSSQLPVYYNNKGTGDYLDMSAQPLYPFGYGLSYTNFILDNLQLERNEITLADLENGQEVKISVDVANLGNMVGAEVVQLYIQDLEASITRRIRELKGFRKIWLKPGEKVTVTLSLTKEELGVWNSEMRFVVEHGNIKIFVGSDSKSCQEVLLSIK
jgi:beta-glucosidase